MCPCSIIISLNREKNMVRLAQMAIPCLISASLGYSGKHSCTPKWKCSKKKKITEGIVN